MPLPAASVETATKSEIETMAIVLEGLHGALAAEIAEFLAEVHAQADDGARERSWSRVARLVRDREHIRLLDDGDELRDF